MELYTPKVSFVTTLRCNLKCKLCAAYSPCYQTPYHPTIDVLKAQIDRFFGVVAEAGYFTLSGGEPLLREDLWGVISHLSKYAQRIRILELITNGSIAPSESTLHALKKYPGSVRIIIDDYGPKLSKMVDRDLELFSGLENVNIKLHDYHSNRLHCDGWVDYGVRAENIKTVEEAVRLYRKCAIPQKLKCLAYIDGSTYLCSQSRRCVELGLTSNDGREAVNLFDSSLTLNELRSRVQGQYELKYISACQFCNGLCDDSQRYKPAEQLK